MDRNSAQPTAASALSTPKSFSPLHGLGDRGGRVIWRWERVSVEDAAKAIEHRRRAWRLAGGPGAPVARPIEAAGPDACANPAPVEWLASPALLVPQPRTKGSPMNLNRAQLLTVSLFAATAVILCSSPAFASMIPGVQMAAPGQMPWETVLGKIVGSLTGTTAKLIALLGLAICGYLYITGEGHTSKLLKVGLGMALLVGGGQIVSMFFASGSGAVV